MQDEDDVDDLRAQVKELEELLDEQKVVMTTLRQRAATTHEQQQTPDKQIAMLRTTLEHV